MKTGSCAAKACEPRQVREEATVSSPFRVPQENLVGVGWQRQAGEALSTVGARPIILVQSCHRQLPLTR